MAAMKSIFNVPVPRRQFLKASSAAAIGLAASGLLNPKSLLAGEAPVVLPLLGVGFTPDEVGHKGVRLTDARDVLSGDPTFISRGARLTIASFSPMPPARSNKASAGAAIDAIFPALGRTAEHYPRFQAWAYRTKESGPDAGISSFTMPVIATDGVQLVVRPLAPIGADAAKFTATQSALTLSLGSTNGAYKLQKGIYVVAFRDAFGSDDAPLWNRLTLTSRDEHELVVPNAHFAYLVLKVDYAHES